MKTYIHADMDEEGKVKIDARGKWLDVSTMLLQSICQIATIGGMTASEMLDDLKECLEEGE